MTARALCVCVVVPICLVAACGDDDGSGGMDSGPVEVDSGGRDSAAPDAPVREPVLDCLGSVTVDPPAGATITASATVLDFLSRNPVPNTMVKLCERSDATCATPTAMGTADAMGMITLTTDAGMHGWFGYTEVSAEGYPTNLGFLSLPITMDFEADGFLVAEGALNLLASAGGVTPDFETKGTIGLVVRDCEAFAMRGATVTHDSDGELQYFAGGAPDPDATSTPDSGLVAIWNATPGTVTLTSHAPGGGAMGAVTVIVRAGAFTQAFIDPTPDGGVFVPES